MAKNMGKYQAKEMGFFSDKGVCRKRFFDREKTRYFVFIGIPTTIQLTRTIAAQRGELKRISR